ncbi:DUF3169 family protein [Streptococcus salivarius]|nr:DUF3169 family protein [Streptococcus salivarius]
MIMKKQQQERSPRYRFWRNVGIITVSGLIGGVIGVLTGMFGSKTSIELQNLFDKEDLYVGSFILFLIIFAIVLSLLLMSRKSYYKMSETEDEEAYIFESQMKKCYDLATIFKGILLIPYMFVIIFYTQQYSLDDKMTGTYMHIFGSYTMFYIFVSLFAMFVVADQLYRKTFKLIYGMEIPRNANAKEVREFMMSRMDEAEKQISYEENFEVVVKLSNYILPSLLIALLIIGIAFQTDILLALLVVSILYIYILISQYKITKRYYKE